MSGLAKTVLLLAIALVLGLCAIGWHFPVSSLAAPQWEVVVVDESGNSVEDVTVRETWKNYSVEDEGHEADLRTGANGEVVFPIRKAEHSIPRQLLGNVFTALQLNVHNSYGPHATVFAFGKGLEGFATTGAFVADWTGSPSFMKSLIVVKPMRSIK